MTGAAGPGLPPIRSWLYAPGISGRLIAKVFDAGADAVILDLEDSVRPEDKAQARRLVGEAILGRRSAASPVIFVRINHPRTGLAEADLDAVVRTGLTGIRVPKVESAVEVAWIADRLDALERSRGLASGTIGLVCGIESARGIVGLEAIASAHPRVWSLSFGVADYAADVGASPGPQGLETLYARSRLVVVSRAAGLAPPIESTHLRIDDDEGLRRTSADSRMLGFAGRAAIHPRQVPIINEIFAPSPAELATARDIVRAAAGPAGSGAFRLPTGEFVDAAIVRRAQRTIALGPAASQPPREEHQT